MNIGDFFLRYYVEPLGKYYTLPATLTYAAIFLVSLYLVYKLCERMKIKFTEEFVFALLPFIFLGGVIRALRDAQIIYTSVLFVSPPIYFFMFVLVFSFVLISKKLAEKMKKNENFILTVFGVVLLIFHLFLVQITNFEALIYILALWGVLATLSFFLFKIIKSQSVLSPIAVSAQLLDACSAFVSIELFGYGEQHVLSSWLMESFGTWIFVPVKFFLSFVAVLMIDKYSENENLKNYLKFIIITLGFALGTRNMLRVSMNV